VYICVYMCVCVVSAFVCVQLHVQYGAMCVK